eukprot:TRINITY_DN27836_c0_g1_i1.p1 TRINITY_DN27836_c0_g1~~TRINITY_DN27836_c0_g1_i1.p1  ORF type:complete len:354 (+),score=23.23 TRINITY_DN27836_c0_g1_i1:114-1175(+)
MAALSQATSRSLHEICVDGNTVPLRVFCSSGPDDVKKPVVVMVCGLMWLGNGFLGRIGLAFNDMFGYAFASSGVTCVQVHTPARHLAHTHIVDLVVILLWPLSLIPVLNWPILLANLLFLIWNSADLLLLALIPFVSLLGPVALPTYHLLIRGFQWMQGTIPAHSPRSHQNEIHATVAWVRENEECLEGDGRVILCGYSSGGQCAALYALSPRAPKFDAVVLISGVYSLDTDSWTGARRMLAPMFNGLFKETLGVDTPDQRLQQSPELMVKEVHKGQPWYVLSAKMELMGLQPFEDILFRSESLCKALEAKGGTVHRITCGLNHWLLVLKIKEFISPFCASLTQKLDQAISFK